eukprot:scaffold253545_cov39-Prasinocladus_malaysianus.AAC.1
MSRAKLQFAPQKFCSNDGRAKTNCRRRLPCCYQLATGSATERRVIKRGFLVMPGACEGIETLGVKEARRAAGHTKRCSPMVGH